MIVIVIHPVAQVFVYIILLVMLWRLTAAPEAASTLDPRVNNIAFLPARTGFCEGAYYDLRMEQVLTDTLCLKLCAYSPFCHVCTFARTTHMCYLAHKVPDNSCFLAYYLNHSTYVAAETIFAYDD